VILALGAAGCAAQQLPPSQLMVPCEDPVIPPRAPAGVNAQKASDALKTLGKWTIPVQLAREATTDRLRECKARHDALVAWVQQRNGR
jgi:hypothetical protein